MTVLSSRWPREGLLFAARVGSVPCVGPRRVPPRRAGSWAGSLPARAVLLARARRVSARLPSNFHLLAQMKVTKAKGLEHQPFEWFAPATRLLPRLWHENVQRATLSVTSLTFSRSSAFRLDPAGPRRGGVPRSWPTNTVQPLPAAGLSSRATGAAAKAQPVAAHPLGSSVALPMGRTRKFACSRSEQAKWAGVRALCFGDFHLGQQMKVTRQPGRDPAGSLAENQPCGKQDPAGSPAGNQLGGKPDPAGSLKGSPP
jgi:hypothetical protein